MVTCEHCGAPTEDWRDTGYYCSDACYQEEIRLLVNSLDR